MLYVYTIQKARLPAEAYQIYLDAAIQLQRHLSRFIEDSSLVTRYCLVLEELRLDALRQIRRQSSPSAEDEALQNPSAPYYTDAIAADYANVLGVPAPYQVDNNGQEINFAPADFATWIQFDSLARDSWLHL